MSRLSSADMQARIAALDMQIREAEKQRQDLMRQQQAQRQVEAKVAAELGSGDSMLLPRLAAMSQCLTRGGTVSDEEFKGLMREGRQFCDVARQMLLRFIDDEMAKGEPLRDLTATADSLTQQAKRFARTVPVEDVAPEVEPSLCQRALYCMSCGLFGKPAVDDKARPLLDVADDGSSLDSDGCDSEVGLPQEYRKP